MHVYHLSCRIYSNFASAHVVACIEILQKVRERQNQSVESTCELFLQTTCCIITAGPLRARPAAQRTRITQHIVIQTAPPPHIYTQYETRKQDVSSLTVGHIARAMSKQSEFANTKGLDGLVVSVLVATEH